jgi:SAM-dependent methyltransferase
LSTLRFQLFPHLLLSISRDLFLTASCSLFLSSVQKKSRESDPRFNTIHNVCPSGTHIFYHDDDQHHTLQPPVVLRQLRYHLRTPHRPRHPRHRHPYRHLHPPHTRALVLDNACGTGAIASAALQRYPSAQIRCVDASPDMVDIMQAQIRSNGWASNVSTAVMSGQDLKFGDSAFDASVTNFGIFFLPDPVAGPAKSGGR